MWCFGRKRKKERVEHAASDRKATIEIIAHKKASREAVRRVEKANQQLSEALAGNGFTVKIFLAAGGKPPTHRKGAKS